MKLKLLISPFSKTAYYDDYLNVSRLELLEYFPESSFELNHFGGMDFIETELPGDVLPQLANLSTIQGIFEDNGDSGLVPLDAVPTFKLPESIVFGSKYQGKTNETVSQMALNLAVLYCKTNREKKSLMDPLAGRGTSLLWALRYGINSVGIEIDPKALDGLHNHVKKQTKLHHIKHQHSYGSVGKSRKDGVGKFTQYRFDETTLKLITGDSRSTPELVAKQQFDMIVTDLPYGIQFKPEGGYKIVELVNQCAQGWINSLRPGGSMVIVFNSFQPRRKELSDIFQRPDCIVHPFKAPHRMSESIIRDFLVVTKH
ncbi:MAG: hypothetical protein JXR95_04230 [Deltaproteobacteria bacterium]|nr:hypothetical protein [Deltaproteobacteria bacterium]